MIANCFLSVARCCFWLVLSSSSSSSKPFSTVFDSSFLIFSSFSHLFFLKFKFVPFQIYNWPSQICPCPPPPPLSLPDSFDLCTCLSRFWIVISNNFFTFFFPNQHFLSIPPFAHFPRSVHVDLVDVSNSCLEHKFKTMSSITDPFFDHLTWNIFWF